MNELILLKKELFDEIERCALLFKSEVLISRSLFSESAFIEILIRLNDVLQQLDKKGNRVTWQDDIQTDEPISDITDLINNMRNAACHNRGPKSYTSNSKIRSVFNRGTGKGCFFKFGNNELKSDYEDETAFFYGDKRVYLKRHIERLLRELPREIDKLNQ